jgi:hypothetical protein
MKYVYTHRVDVAEMLAKLRVMVLFFTGYLGGQWEDSSGYSGSSITLFLIS